MFKTERQSRKIRWSRRQRTSCLRRACVETLEPRMLLSGVPVAGGVPILHSNPSATVKIYLDFDGDLATTWNGMNVPTTPAYDIDADPTTFSPQELANIQVFWAR